MVDCNPVNHYYIGWIVLKIWLAELDETSET